jgi:hypothetical protein
MPSAFAILRLRASSYHLFCLDVRRFDYRPPLLNIVLERRPHPFRRALIVRRNFQTWIGEQSAYRSEDPKLMLTLDEGVSACARLRFDIS